MTRWSLTLVTGFFCGLVALSVAFCTRLLSRYKFHTFHQLIEKEKTNDLPFGSAYLFLFGINLAFGLIAWLTVYFEPLAAGSGTLQYVWVRLPTTRCC
jgi:H+/Cl- antiporter ClcA